MKIILLQDIKNTGKKGDIKDVADGYAFNSLIPSGKAVVATASAIKKLEIEKKQSQEKERIQEELLAKNLKDIDGKTISMIEKVNDIGHLFASVHQNEIAKAINDTFSFLVKPEYVSLNKPIKEAGEHLVDIKVGKKIATIKLVITADKK